MFQALGRGSRVRGLNLWSRVLYYISNKEPAPNSIMAPRFMSGDSFKGSWGGLLMSCSPSCLILQVGFMISPCPIGRLWMNQILTVQDAQEVYAPENTTIHNESCFKPKADQVGSRTLKVHSQACKSPQQHSLCNL